MFGIGKWERLCAQQSETLKDAGDEIESLNAEARKLLAELVRLRTEIEQMRARLIEEHGGGHRLMAEFCPTCQASPKS